MTYASERHGAFLQQERMVLERRLATVNKELADIHQAIAAIDSDISNHVYASLEKAEAALMNKFENEAHEACEGSYNCGMEEYSQAFIVDGVKYLGIGTFEYNRAEKTFYYVDGSKWSYKLLEG